MEKISRLLLGALVTATAMLGLACHKLYANGDNGNTAATPNATAATVPAPTQPASDNPEDRMPRVKVQDAVKEVADGKAVVIDVRGTDAYKLSHIKGALDVPLTKLENKDFSGLPKDKRIIAYCT